MVFECQAAWAAERVRWEINGRSWDIRDPPPAEMSITPDRTWNSSVFSRRLRAGREYNNSRVQCVLNLRSAGETVYSDVALLLVRGQSVFASEQQILRVSYRFFTGPEVRECNDWFSGSFLLLSILP